MAARGALPDLDAGLLLRNLLFTVVVPGTVAVGVPVLCFGRSGTGAPAALRLAGLCLLALGCAIYLWCLWDFASFGRGTPAPIDAPRRLVIRGLYRWVRNPMYVGVLSAILGWSAWFGSAGLLVYAAAVATAFHGFVVLYEEPALERRFGDEYRRYRSKVGRWWPRRGKEAATRRPTRSEPQASEGRSPSASE